MKLNKKEIRVLSGLLLTEQAELTDLIELSDGNDMFKKLYDFCIEKKAMNGIDPELKAFCATNKNLTFSEAKREFDKKNKRY